ncbi:mechanosensitive ion channel family protein [Vibrio rhizosphaerae]|uniref:Mechanosensitive ion channel family protein n=1 Tax=Vibrio rhizosphaerae TaxID=398736 RepID=A0ABU4IZF3_9VIBR|nr:mechanosensitive ion channel family protein [Vibrio rhizosphaerae]MDW6094649.1 mechanosensitive ion channel family protein [Vibrio rhizosphaerae]
MNSWITDILSSPIWQREDTNVLFITLASFVAWMLWRFLYRHLNQITEKTKVRWDDLLLHALRSPISVLIWLWPAMISLGLLLEDLSKSRLDWLETLKLVLLVCCFVWTLIRLVDNIENYILQTKDKDKTTVQAISKVVKLLVFVVGLLSVMQTFGLSLSGLLTFGGVGGLVVGFAAKDLLSNFFGGMMIYFDRPFKVGDWIRSPDRAIEGTVERIGWRMTVIRTFDKRPLYVPNSVFSSIVVENPSRMLNRRIYEVIGLRYGDSEKVAAIVADVREMLEGHTDIDATQTLIVNFDSFGASSLDFFIYTFTKTVNWMRYHEVKQDVLLKVMDIIHHHGADIAYPTQTLKLEPESAGTESLEARLNQG